MNSIELADRDQVDVNNDSNMNFDNNENMSSNFTNSTTMETTKIGQIILICIYGTLSIGILLNCSVVGTIVSIFRNLKRLTSVNKHTFLYIMTLSLVDTLVLINLPLIVTDMLIGWVFGTVICKLHLTTEMINKTLSTFILTSLSFDRFLIVCYPHRFRQWRRFSVTAIVLALCCISAGLLLMPMYMHNQVVPLYFGRKNVTKCLSLWHEFAFGRNYLYAIFGMGYCVPLVLMTIFYGCIVIKMWRSSNRARRQSTGRRSYTRKVTQRTAILVAFYFFCWTPYWVVHFYLENSQAPSPNDSHSSLKILMIHFVHVLVYLNSAANPLLYALLNRELRRQCFLAKQNKRGNYSESIDVGPGNQISVTNGKNSCRKSCFETNHVVSTC